MKLACIFIIVCALYIGNSLPSPEQGFTTFWSTPKTETVAAEADTSQKFERGYTDLQNQPCFNKHTRAKYESDILSPEEIKHYLIQAGASPEQAHVMQAIAKAESGHQLNCWGDETPQYMNKRASNGQTWTESYGLFQIRTIKEMAGTGDCRDIERLRNNVEQQTQCAWEISGNGRSFRPWSVYLNGKYRQYL